MQVIKQAALAALLGFIALLGGVGLVVGARVARQKYLSKEKS